MKQLTSSQIRALWLDFFEKHNHLVIKSKSLVPENDPSLLLINSGVATLKEYFSGKKKPPHVDLVNSQKCIRTNDIENVGTTTRHLTFFEMLGNFSIGGYFKEKAIQLAYEFLFKVLKFPQTKIYITYHYNDEITYNEWLKMGIDASHLIKGNDKTNFWDVGRGPCGYDTEIFYDRGLKFDPNKKGLELLEKDIDNDRYLEIWNIVFSEFNNDGHDNYTELKLKNIDTGAGLERIAAIFQNAPTNFDTDLFLPIIKRIEKMTNMQYDVNNYFTNDSKQQKINKYFKIIADHIRAITIAIEDGVKPSNTARGYIVRKLIRRAYRVGIKLNLNKQTFLHELVEVVAKTLPIYPIKINQVSKIIFHEETVFARTIKQGEELLWKAIHENKIIDSEIAFKLFETYGYPVELTKEIANEYHIKLDLTDFERLKQEHAQISKKKNISGMDLQLQVIQNIKNKVSEFIGYDNLNAKSELIFQDQENDKNYLLFNKTPFYATSGGQLFDQGLINQEPVIDVFKDQYGNHWHVTLNEINDSMAELKVDKINRIKTMKNHSATHLLGKAIFDVLGYTTQLGSENNSHKLRLDFPSDKRPSDENIQAIENKVNQYIKDQLKRKYIITTKREAINMGAWILEKEAKETTYDDIVRVVDFAGISIELCGGTHVENSKDIEQFKIIKVESKGSGTYRIEAITSFDTIKVYEQEEINKYLVIFNNLIAKNQLLNKKYKIDKPQSLDDLKLAIEKVKIDYKKLLKETKSQIKIDELEIKFIDFHNMPTYINLTIDDIKKAQSLAIKLREFYAEKLIILGVKGIDKQTIIIASKKYDANEILQKIITKHHGRGGGQKVFAMGSIDLVDKL